MKFNKRHMNQLDEFFSLMDRDGCVPVDEWTSGSGRYTTNKALPPFVERIARADLRTRISLKGNIVCEEEKGSNKETAFNWFAKDGNERRKFVLVLDKESLKEFFLECARGREF